MPSYTNVTLFLCYISEHWTTARTLDMTYLKRGTSSINQFLLRQTTTWSIELFAFFHGSTILFYRRCVDDTFCLFNSDRNATTFFDYINSGHPNIKFTMVKQVNPKLPFFDVLIYNHDPNASLTRVYRKETFIGLLISYFSFTSYSYKIGLIKTLVDRAYKINNTSLRFHEDINKLTDILKKNLFPAHLIE